MRGVWKRDRTTDASLLAPVPTGHQEAEWVKAGRPTPTVKVTAPSLPAATEKRLSKRLQIDLTPAIWRLIQKKMPLGRAQADPCKNLSWLPLPSSWGWWLDFSARARDSQNHSFLTLSVSITSFLPDTCRILLWPTKAGVLRELINASSSTTWRREGGTE